MHSSAEIERIKVRALCPFQCHFTSSGIQQTNHWVQSNEFRERERDPITNKEKKCFPFPHGIPRIPFDREIFFWFWVKLVSETMMRWQMNGANQCRTGYIFNQKLKCTYDLLAGPSSSSSHRRQQKEMKNERRDFSLLQIARRLNANSTKYSNSTRTFRTAVVQQCAIY